MKATVLVDNIPNKDLLGEWGLCIYIEHQGQNILLDAGASRLFAENAAKLGLSLQAVDYAVLSHAHYDHADGMKYFFQANSQAKFYLRDKCQENCYKQQWLWKKYIGLPRGVMGQYAGRIQLVAGDYQLTEGVYLLPHKTAGLAAIGQKEHMYQKINGKWQPDNFDHEQSLVLNTPQGLIIFNSCCHGGADNIIKEIQATFPAQRLLAIIGGFHLYNKTEQQVQAFAQRLKATGVKHIFTGHCTGQQAFAIMQAELGSALQPLQVGAVIAI